MIEVKRSCLDLTDRVAVVFGGTSGLGKEIAIGLAEHGANVLPAGRRETSLKQVCDEISKLGRRTFCQPVDVKDRASIERFRDSALNELGRVDILVNAAGITFRKPTVDVSAAEWSTLFDTNLTGVLQTCQVFYESLKASEAGRVINVASLGSYLAFHEVAAN